MVLKSWPASDLDVPERLLAALGSFWAHVYQGIDLVASLVHGRARLEDQTDIDLQELYDLRSRLQVPVWHREQWYCLSLKESARNQTDALLAHFDGQHAFTPSSSLRFDEAGDTTWQVWPAPSGLIQANVIVATVTQSGLCWCHGNDFMLKDGALWFRENPFDQEGVLVKEIFQGNVVSDRTCELWLYRSLWDVDTIHTQFGYVLGLAHSSSSAYKDLVNIVFDGLVQGTSCRIIQEAFAALADVTLARNAEVVVGIYQDNQGVCVVTDQNAYRYQAGSTVLVKPGDWLQPGDTITDSVLFYELAGAVPASIRALAVGQDFLAEGYFQDLVFENKDVPLLLSPDPAGGPSKVSFAVSGLPDDADKFWNDVHTAGVAAGTPLVALLPAPLPATINPLAFLVQNIFRNNVFVVKLRPDLFGPNALGLSSAVVLRRLVPPWTACIIVVELTYNGDKVTMAGPGDTSTPGYEETVQVFLTQNVSETIASTLVAESVTCRQLGGQCQ